MIDFKNSKQCDGDNIYIDHHSAPLTDFDGRSIGHVLYSRYDAMTAEKDKAPKRFIVHADSYLQQLSEILFSQDSRYAVLPTSIREDLSENFRYAIIIDEISLIDEIVEDYNLTVSIISRVIQELSNHCDLIIVNEWQSFGKHLNLSPRIILKGLQHIGVIPFNSHYLLAFSEDIATHIQLDTID